MHAFVWLSTLLLFVGYCDCIGFIESGNGRVDGKRSDKEKLLKKRGSQANVGAQEKGLRCNQIMIDSMVCDSKYIE